MCVALVAVVPEVKLTTVRRPGLAWMADLARRAHFVLERTDRIHDFRSLASYYTFHVLLTHLGVQLRISHEAMVRSNV